MSDRLDAKTCVNDDQGGTWWNALGLNQLLILVVDRNDETTPLAYICHSTLSAPQHSSEQAIPLGNVMPPNCWTRNCAASLLPQGLANSQSGPDRRTRDHSLTNPLYS